MNREIKFRGKRIDNGEWVYGYLVGKAFDGTSKIIDIGIQKDGCYPVEVDPETVGQYTGEHTRLSGKGKEIWEGDRVKVNVLGINYSSEWITGFVKYVDGCFTVIFSNPVYDPNTQCNRRNLYVKCFVVNNAIEVIGNIYESPKEEQL
jgi:uncharacterized phage protein (TIGR01671 family)